MRLRALLAFLMLAISAQAQALPVTTAAGNPTIVVGIVATLSGSGAMAGQDTVDGFSTALRQLGGRFANQEVRVVVVDDKGSPDTAIQVTRRLLEREKLDFVLTAVSQPSLSAIIRPLLESRLFVLNMEAGPSGLMAGDCHPSLFQMGMPAEAGHDAVAAVLGTEKLRRVALIGPDSAGTQAAAEQLRRSWAGEVAEVFLVRSGTIGFKAELERLRKLSPDAVYSLLGGGVGGAFLREFAASGLKGEMLLLNTWTGLERPLLPGLGEMGLDLVSVAPWSPDLDTPLNKRMISDFELEFGRPATTWVAQGYDAAHLLEAVMKGTNGRTTDREAVRLGLRRADFVSVRGPFRFDADHAPSLNLYLRRVIKDAKGRLTHEVRGLALKEWHFRDAALCPMRWEEPKPAGAPPGQPQAPKSPKPKPPQAPNRPNAALPPAAGH